MKLARPRPGDRGQFGGAVREVQRGKGEGFDVQALVARIRHFAPPLYDVMLGSEAIAQGHSERLDWVGKVHAAGFRAVQYCA